MSDASTEPKATAEDLKSHAKESAMEVVKEFMHHPIDAFHHHKPEVVGFAAGSIVAAVATMGATIASAGNIFVGGAVGGVQ